MILSKSNMANVLNLVMHTVRIYPLLSASQEGIPGSTDCQVVKCPLWSSFNAKLIL